MYVNLEISQDWWHRSFMPEK